MSQPTARPWSGPAGTRATAAAAATVAAAVFTVPAANAVVSATEEQPAALPFPAAVSDVSPVVHHTIPVSLSTALSTALSPSRAVPVPLPRMSPEGRPPGGSAVPGATGGSAVPGAAGAAGRNGAAKVVSGALREADAAESIQRYLAGPGASAGQPHKIAELLTPPVAPSVAPTAGGSPATGVAGAGAAGAAGGRPARLIMPPVPSKAGAALNAAMGVRGTPYRWGGTGRGGFDCSGLAQWAYRKAGITLPRSSRAQSAVGTPVSRKDLRPGDLVFFYRPVSHVGIYVGNGNVVHAPQTGDVVKISPISRMPFAGARRL